MESSSGSAPLAGVRVADLSRVLAGPYCTMVLADLGADVIKVERPEGGDETRSWGPPFAGGEAAYYLSVNRGKRSCALDLSQPEGRALALELCAAADVVIENFKVGGADRLGVGYEQVREHNPTVVYCSITGFGSEREPPGRPGYDFVAQAESGLMSITGPEDGPAVQGGRRAGRRAHRPSRRGRRARRAARGRGWPHRGAAARQRPRRARERGPERARHRERAGAAWERAPEHRALPGLSRPPPAGSRWPRRTTDCSARSARRWGCEELARDERFATNAVRVEHRRELVPLLADRFRERSAEEWLAALDAAGVPAGKVRSVPDALDAAAAAGRPATVTVEHPTAGPLDLVASPIWGATRTEATPPPLLGEHTAEVLGELGRSAEEIEALARAQVVDPTAPCVEHSARGACASAPRPGSMRAGVTPRRAR